MPTHQHELLIEMFRQRPALAAELLDGTLGLPVPEYRQAQLICNELTDIAPTEYRADAVITLDGEDAPTLAIVIEVQLRTDPRKRRSWPAYVATLYARLGSPVTLLALCPDQAVATWCATPIVVGYPDMILTPMVLGPAQIPVFTDPGTARRNPELAILSSLAHSDRPDPTPVFASLYTALHVFDLEHATMYHDLVMAMLPDLARRRLEEFMTATAEGRAYQSEFARRYYSQGEAQGRAEGVAQGRAEGEAQGRAEGEARAVLMILGTRGIEVPDQVRARIERCTDRDQLETWIRRAATAEKIEDLGDL